MEKLRDKLIVIKDEVIKIDKKAPFNIIIDRINNLVTNKIGENRFTSRLMNLKSNNAHSGLYDDEQKALIIEIDSILDELENLSTEQLNNKSMKEKLIILLTKQKEFGDALKLKLEHTFNSEQLSELITQYRLWDKINREVLEKAYEQKQLFRMYSSISYLGNINVAKESFQSKRDELIECLPKKVAHLNIAINHTSSLRNIDLLPFDEKIKTIDTNLKTKITDMKKLFVSHASIDKAKIEPLIDLIVVIGVPYSQIFFSSSPASGVGLGENIFERLKKELSSDVFALFILSKNFYSSAVCLCEMGAVWIKSSKQIPILIPPFKFSDMKGVFPNSLGFNINDKDQLNSFKIELETNFNLIPIHLTWWETKRDEYLKKINEII